MWLSWLEHQLDNRKITGLIPGQGTGPGCGFGPLLRCVWEVTNQYVSLTLVFLSLSFSLHSPLSNKEINILMVKLGH